MGSSIYTKIYSLKRKNLFYKRTHEAEEVKNIIYVDIKSCIVDINTGKAKYKLVTYTNSFRVESRDDGRRISLTLIWIKL